jgi:hypothetical protein
MLLLCMCAVRSFFFFNSVIQLCSYGKRTAVIAGNLKYGIHFLFFYFLVKEGANAIYLTSTSQRYQTLLRWFKCSHSWYAANTVMQSNKIIAPLVNSDYMMLSRQIQASAVPSQLRTHVPLEQDFCHPCSCCEIFMVFVFLCSKLWNLI